MKKSDLKNRMVVETRNGNRFIVVDEYILNVNGRGYMMLDSYSDDLMNKSIGFSAWAIKINRKYDIMKVYDQTKTWDYHNEDDLLWERKESEPVEMSFDEVQKILGIDNLKIKMSSNEIISRCDSK